MIHIGVSPALSSCHLVGAMSKVNCQQLELHAQTTAIQITQACWGGGEPVYVVEILQ